MVVKHMNYCCCTNYFALIYFLNLKSGDSEMCLAFVPHIAWRGSLFVNYSDLVQDHVSGSIEINIHPFRGQHMLLKEYPF